MYLDRLGLEDCSVIVSGAGGGGIGTATCDAVAEAGADVVALDIDAEAMAESARRVQKHGRRCVSIQVDVRSPESVESAIARAADELGPPRGLVNVVGGALAPHWRSLLDYPLEAYEDVLSLNLRSAFLVSQATARSMVMQGVAGSIVCLSSISSAAASPFHFPYGVAKAGIRQMVQSMAVEWAEHGIRVNAIAPGTIKTPRAGVRDDPKRDRRAIPLGRRGEPEEIAAAALFLLSNWSSYISGQTLTVDGGATAKLAFLGEDNLPLFVDSDEIRAQVGTSAGRRDKARDA